jgi:TRAP-type mannitol/chloroaromatic compound transport system substrate-binding protein
MRQFRSVLALACAATFAAGAQAQQSTTLKMQATWPASLTLYENFTYFADRINKVSGGQLKIDAMPAGQVVPAFEVLDATHKKVLDGAHSWSGYWVGKSKTAILFTAARAARSAWT